jgi:hypothetical protein
VRRLVRPVVAESKEWVGMCVWVGTASKWLAIPEDKVRTPAGVMAFTEIVSKVEMGVTDLPYYLYYCGWQKPMSPAGQIRE